MSARIDPIDKNLLPKVDPQKLRDARGSRTIVSVAEALGMSRQHIWQIENGHRAPGAEILARLCWLYDVDIADLTTTNGKRKAA